MELTAIQVSQDHKQSHRTSAGCLVALVAFGLFCVVSSKEEDERREQALREIRLQQFEYDRQRTERRSNPLWSQLPADKIAQYLDGLWEILPYRGNEEMFIGPPYDPRGDNRLSTGAFILIDRSGGYRRRLIDAHGDDIAMLLRPPEPGWYSRFRR